MEQHIEKSIVHQWLLGVMTASGNKFKNLKAALGGVLWKKVFLQISQEITGKHLCQSLFFNEVASLKPATLLKRDFGTGEVWSRIYHKKYFW